MNLDEMIAELSAGRDARARVPALETRIKDITSWKERTEQHNQELELNIIGYKQSIDALQAKVVDLTKARDDAQFAQAEAEENLKSFREVVRGFASIVMGAGEDLAKADHAFDPPKPVQPVPVPMIEGNGGTSGQTSTQTTGSIVGSSSQGQSEPGPIASSNTDTTHATASAQSVAGQGDVSTGAASEPAPFSTAVSAPDPMPLAGGVGPLPEPKSDYERSRMKQGLDWYDTDGICHAPLLIKA